MKQQTLSFSVSKHSGGSVVMATLDRPPLNTTVKSTYMEIIDLVRDINADPSVSCLIIAAEGKVFSAGADKNDFQNASPAESAERRPVLRAACDALFSCEVPIITAVHGPAVGAGALVAAAGDIILMSPEAFISIPEIDAGVIGAARGLAKIVPPQKVRGMALTGQRLSTEDLDKYGAIHEVVPQDHIHERALEIAYKLNTHGALMLRKWKEALDVASDVSPKAGLLIEQCLSQELALVK